MGTTATAHRRRRPSAVLASAVASLLLAAPSASAACLVVPPGRTAGRERGSRGPAPSTARGAGAGGMVPPPPPAPPSAPERGVLRSLARDAAAALVAADRAGDALTHSYGSESQGLWVHGPSAERLGETVGRVQVRRPGGAKGRCGPGRMGRPGRWGRSRGPRSDDVSGRCDVSLGMCPNGDTPDVRHRRRLRRSGRPGGPGRVGASGRRDAGLRMSEADEPSDAPDLSRPGRTAEGDRALEELAGTAVGTLVESDVRRGEYGANSDGSSSQGRWLYDPAAKRLERVLDRLDAIAEDDDDEACGQWLRFMKRSPSPMFVDLTGRFRDIIAANHRDGGAPWVTNEHLDSVDMTLDGYLGRLRCHLIVLPSGGGTAPLSLVESAGAHVYGRLLYGGVTRYRLVRSGGTTRRAGERREVAPSSSGEGTGGGGPSWVQLGGLERRYEAVDMGPAAVLEVVLMPRLWQDLPTVFDRATVVGGPVGDTVLTPGPAGWDPSAVLRLLPEDTGGGKGGSGEDDGVPETRPADGERREELANRLRDRVGGLSAQVEAIVRRVVDGRSIYAASPGGGGGEAGDPVSASRARREAEELALLGLQPVRGLLLYGEPGVGKTLIVREVARALNAREPKIVAASELLDRWVGGSEKLVRELFRDAEDELEACRLSARPGEEDLAYLNSALHVVVVDEIDAVFRRRSDGQDSGGAARDSVVNQLLSKLDGIRALPNVLVVGMTNRRELLDPALLRPGRLEVQVEIPMPDREGRREILGIHFGALRRRNRLSYPLRCAIDGMRPGHDNRESAKVGEHVGNRKRDRIKRAADGILRGGLSLSSRSRNVDLAELTVGFSGADIAGLVRCAGSLALARCRKDGGGVDSLIITLEDALIALEEVKA